jgi:hypothetical protein
MNRVTRFNDYSFTESMVDDFINSFGLNESNDDESEVIDEIFRRYKERFGDKKPTNA